MMDKNSKSSPSSAPKAANVPWEKAIRQVLGEADGSLHYSEIAERIASKGLRTNLGATPAATVASYLSTSLREDSTPFLRVGRGEYTLKQGDINKKPAQEKAAAQDDVAQTGALRSFGMFWRRDLVIWTTALPMLLGRQGPGALEVDFGAQIGVYLLHDRERVIYVGRAADMLSSRLRLHTTDRLGGRWDRFSWFGLRALDEKGAFTSSIVPWTQEVVIETSCAD